MFSGKTFLLTGATKGIGNQIAHHLVKEHARLILIARNINELNELKDDLEDKEDRHLVFPLDVSNSSIVKQAFEVINNKFLFLDGIINCAGSFGAIGKLEDVAPEEFLKSISVNLLGSYNISYYGLNLLKKSERGKLINLSGGGVTAAFPNYSGYACGKIALAKLTENLAEEYPELDINIIAPGFIKTELANQTIIAGKRAGMFYEKTKAMLINGGVDAKHSLELVSFLLNRESDGISGKLISAPWDEWKSLDFQKRLKDDKDFCSIRRIDNKYFKKIESDL